MTEKRTVQEKNDRNEARTRALTKKPTPSLNQHGLSSLQMRQVLTTKGEASKTVRTAITRKDLIQRRHRPLKAHRNPSNDPRSLLAAPANGTKMATEFPTPAWFRKNEKVDVSIIIPLYKSRAVVADLIQSWPMNDTARTWEIIFVDDKCPLNSKEAVVHAWEYKAKSSGKMIGKIIYNTENKGYGLACNIGG